MALIAGSLHFLTQFMSFHGLHFLLVISLILLWKKVCLVFLTVLLNFFQSSRHLDWWYMLRSLWQSLSHHALECLVILIFLKYLCQVLSILVANFWTMFSRALLLWIEDISMFLMVSMSSLMKWFSSSLFLMRDHFFVCMYLSIINMLTVIDAWSEVSLQLEWMI